MSRRIKNTISSKELLQAMGGIRDCYVKEADYAACAATRKQPHRWYVAAGMAAMLALSILLPNLNKATAYAMQSLPVIGEYFKLVTFREYRFDDGRHSADVKWNKIYADRAGMDDSEEIGKQQAYIDSLKERIGQESDYAGRMRDEKYEQELKVQKANQKIFELQRTNEQMGRLLSKIPPEVLEELQKNHRSRAKER